MSWSYFILGIVAYQIGKLLALAINHEIVRWRTKRFLKVVSVEFPDNSRISFISIEGSDKRAMKRLERQVREQFNIPEESAENSRENHGV